MVWQNLCTLAQVQKQHLGASYNLGLHVSLMMVVVVVVVLSAMGDTRWQSMN
jgi:hypothetical protein